MEEKNKADIERIIGIIKNYHKAYLIESSKHELEVYTAEVIGMTFDRGNTPFLILRSTDDSLNHEYTFDELGQYNIVFNHEDFIKLGKAVLNEIYNNLQE
jgi:hypothetical protein